MQKSNDIRFWRDYFSLKLCISKKSKWKVSEILLLFLYLAIFCIFLVMWVSYFPSILSQIIAIWCRNLMSQYVLWISFYFLILLIRWKDADFKKDERFCDFLRDAKCSVKIYPENKKWQCCTKLLIFLPVLDYILISFLNSFLPYYDSKELLQTLKKILTL